ncbi:UDP-glycosyltransferase 88A1-like [Nymphaea colorata]|uniref:Glycosyltransferase n=1 Tax=Nymphaea colorata TaxID=210225 RepID=A0A5K0Z966_9MAGN|nr:UDP-glycosyltransferase 88A1-like [Nymphaea colorata]
MKKQTVVLFPSPGMGHLMTMVELGKLLHLRHGISITILVAKPPISFGNSAAYMKSVADSGLDFTFTELGPVDFKVEEVDCQSHDVLLFEFLHACRGRVEEALQDISRDCFVKAIILDCFCFTSMEVAASLGIPAYFYYISNAGALALLLYLNALSHQYDVASARAEDKLVHVPGIPPFPPSGLPHTLRFHVGSYEWFLKVSSQFARAKGIIINTFDALHPHTLRALADGLCVPDGPNPLVYAIGPLVAPAEEVPRPPDCLRWLDSQPDNAVVFLCFGSLGLHSAVQLREMALGLERSGRRFLWVVRNPTAESKQALVPVDPDLDVLLPEGFLQRTSDRGMVVKTWAPQARVLNHAAVGGFVTHCGWNSALESISAGVPMIAWPLYAEQPINRVMLVLDMGVAVSVKEDRDGLVSAAEVERCVRLLLDSEEEGARLRERVKAAKDAGVAALKEGGSSLANLARLVDSWNGPAGAKEGG